MAEDKKENKPHTTPDPTEMLMAEVEVRKHDPKKPPRKETVGEVMFNRTVYTGIGLGVNEASALVIADQFQHGVGKKWFESIGNWMEKAFKFKDTVKNGKITTGNAGAKNMLLYVSLLVSGTLLVYPMKKLEDNKGYWVKKVNHWFDKIRGNPKLDDFAIGVDGKQLTGEQVTHADIIAARDKEVEEALACETKQTWPSLIMGRCVAIGTALLLGKTMGKERTDNLMNWSEKLLTGSVKPDGQKDWKSRYAALAAVETLTCTASSIALEIASKTFAKRGLTVRDPETCTEVVHRKNGDENGNGSTSGNGTSGSTENKDTKELTQAAAPTENKLEKFKSKPVIPSEKHVDQIKTGDNSFSMAP